MLFVIWLLLGTLLVAHHVLVFNQAVRKFSLEPNSDNWTQRIARGAILITLIWISSTLLAQLLDWF